MFGGLGCDLVGVGRLGSMLGARSYGCSLSSVVEWWCGC